MRCWEQGKKRLIFLHRLATTSPTIRAETRAGSELVWLVVALCRVSERTEWTWRKRDSVRDRSHMLHGMQMTLSPVQDAA